MFNITFKNIALLNTPISLRKEKNLVWLDVLVKLINDLKSVLLGFREDQLFFLAHNSQVIYLEHILNAKFNNGGSEIYIEDGNDKTKTYIFNKSEGAAITYYYNKSELKPQKYLYNRIEQTPLVAFIVKVPSILIFDEDEMSTLIKRLKLAGKEFTIKTYIL